MQLLKKKETLKTHNPPPHPTTHFEVCVNHEITANEIKEAQPTV